MDLRNRQAAAVAQPEPASPERFTDPVAAVDRLIALYPRNTAPIRNAF